MSPSIQSRWTDKGAARWAGLAALLIVALALPHLLDAATLRIVTAVQVAIIASIATTILVGTAGQLSLAGAAFMSVGAFAAFFLQETFDPPFFVTIICVLVIGAGLGAVLALPALRLRGLYLVLATLGFHYIVSYVTKEYEASRGAAALSGLILNPPDIRSINWAAAKTWYYVIGGCDLLVTIVALNVIRSRFGRAWVALRDRDIVATSLAIPVGLYKILAFALSSALLAFAGVLSSLSVGIVSSEYFSINLAIQILVMAVIGGLGSTVGAWLGAAFVVLLPHLIQGEFGLFHISSSAQLDFIAPLQLILFGAITIAFLLFEPAGLVGLFARLRRTVFRPFRRPARS
jgi:branched-chain amino acid transport system permease protein